LENHEAIQNLKSLIIENDLPRTDMALFGIKCPYCGKSDRIHRLEPPHALARSLNSTRLSQYADLWQRLDSLQAGLGVCKFCLNPLALDTKAGQARALDPM
jgi:hypothetical protein